MIRQIQDLSKRHKLNHIKLENLIISTELKSIDLIEQQAIKKEWLIKQVQLPTHQVQET